MALRFWKKNSDEKDSPKKGPVVDILSELEYYNDKLTKVNELRRLGIVDEAFRIITQLTDRMNETGLFRETDDTRYYCYEGVFEEKLIEVFVNKDKEMRNNPLPYDLVCFNMGSILIDLGKMDKALDYLNEALYWGPANMTCRFERMEYYKIVKNLPKYMEEAIGNVRYIKDRSQASRLYRSLAYGFAEAKRYDLSGALSVKSLYYEPSKIAENEIEYAEQFSKIDFYDLSLDEIDEMIAGYAPVDPYELSSKCIMAMAAEEVKCNDLNSAEQLYLALSEQGNFIGKCLHSCILKKKGTDDGFIDSAFTTTSSKGEESDYFDYYILGLCYKYGFGTQISETEAFRNLKKAASFAYMPALLEMSECYELGIGTNIDSEMCLKYCLAAWVKGSNTAKERMEYLYERYGWDIPIKYKGRNLETISVEERKSILKDLDNKSDDTNESESEYDLNGNEPYPDSNGLYPAEILMIAYSPRYMVNQIEFPGFWKWSYGVSNPVSMINSLVKRGYIQKSEDVGHVLEMQNASSIKELLKSKDLPVSGKKEDLVQRALDNIGPADIRESFRDIYYCPTEKGYEVLANNYQVVALHEADVLDPVRFNIFFKGAGANGCWDFIRMCVIWQKYVDASYKHFIEQLIRRNGWTSEQIDFMINEKITLSNNQSIPAYSALFFDCLIERDQKNFPDPDFWWGLFRSKPDEQLDYLKSIGLIRDDSGLHITELGNQNMNLLSYIGNYAILDDYGVKMSEAKNLVQDMFDLDNLSDPVTDIVWRIIHSKTTKARYGPEISNYESSLFIEYRFYHDQGLMIEAYYPLFACICLSIHSCMKKALLHSESDDLVEFKINLNKYLKTFNYKMEIKEYINDYDAGRLYNLSIESTDLIDTVIPSKEYWSIVSTVMNNNEALLNECIDRIAPEIREEREASEEPDVIQRLSNDPNWRTMDPNFLKDGRYLQRVIKGHKAGNPRFDEMELYLCIRDSLFIVPCITSADTGGILSDAEVKEGATIEIKGDLKYKPALLRDEIGKQYLALFTSEDQMPEGYIQKQQMTVTQSFDECVQMARKLGIGIVIDTFTEEIILDLATSERILRLPSRLKQ